MKKIIVFLVLSLFYISSSQAATVKIKITYNGQAVVGHTVTALIGGSSIGSGVTDSRGELSFSVGSLLSKSVDLKGEKTCDGGKKTWEVSGYVFLDGNNFAHLKMEEPIKEAVEGSGGFFSADMLVASYGLVCSGSSSSTSSSSSSSSDSGSSLGSSSSESMFDEDDEIGSGITNDFSTMSYAERLSAQKTHLENKVYSKEKKIKRKQGQLENKDRSDREISEINLEIKELELEKAIDQNKLDEINITIETGDLNKREKDEFKATEKKLKEELKETRALLKQAKLIEDPVAEVEVKEDNRVVDIGFDADNLPNLTEDELQEMKTSFTTSANNKTLKRRVKGKWMEENDRIFLEKEIAELEAALVLIDVEFERREAQRKADKKKK